MATLPYNADGPGQVSPRTGTPRCTDRIWDLPLTETMMKKAALNTKRETENVYLDH